MPQDPQNILNVSQHDDVLLLDVAADQLTALQTVDTFAEQLTALIAKRPEAWYVINFHDVTFMVTPAVNALLQASRQLKQRGGQIVVCGLNENIRRVFTLMKLDRVIHIEPAPDAGLRRIESLRGDRSPGGSAKDAETDRS